MQLSFDYIAWSVVAVRDWPNSPQTWFLLIYLELEMNRYQDKKGKVTHHVLLEDTPVLLQNTE